MKSGTRPWKRAAAWLALLGPLFYLTYGFANWWASRQPAVPSIVFGWERSIPFWPWTIFPYWSINAFYALSLFLARDRHELDRHAARLLTAQVLAVTCFMLWPLKFAFGQPAVAGAPAFLFDALRSFDQPYNQAPSLHIALALILWDWYRRRLAGPWAHALLHAWTLAICGSVLTTYQHHFIDLPTGALLGLVCIWLWPLERVPSMPSAWRLASWRGERRRWVLAALYGAGAFAFTVSGVALSGAGLLLGWPAVSLAIVALNYLGLGHRGFAMGRDGRMHWAARWLLAPYRLGAWLNARWWTRRCTPAAAIAPGVLFGQLPSLRQWQAAGSPHLVSLCAELQLPRGAGACLPCLDLVALDVQRLRRATLLIERERRAAGSRGIWICCALGFSRSAAAARSWLVETGRARNPAEADAALRLARPEIVLASTSTGEQALPGAKAEG
jgi:protein-tyrosine phosphatase